MCTVAHKMFVRLTPRLAHASCLLFTQFVDISTAYFVYTRYIAITHPIAYSKHRQQPVRLCVMLVLSWTVSIAISLPIAVGMNYTDRRSQTPTVCTFYNDDFLIYSSMGSFYIPCLVMFWLYCRMFRTIRQRAKRTSGRQKYQVTNCRNGSLAAAGAGYCPMRKIAKLGGWVEIARDDGGASGRENPMKAIAEVNENGADTENKYCHATEDLPEDAGRLELSIMLIETSVFNP